MEFVFFLGVRQLAGALNQAPLAAFKSATKAAHFQSHGFGKPIASSHSRSLAIRVALSVGRLNGRPRASTIRPTVPSIRLVVWSRLPLLVSKRRVVTALPFP